MICGGLGVDAKIPDVEIHSLFACMPSCHHFHQRIFARREIFGGSEFQPASADAGDRGFDEVLLLADFAGDLALHVAQDALVAFDLGADDAKAVEGDEGLLGCCGCCGLPRFDAAWPGQLIGRPIGVIVNIDVERRNVDVRLHGGVRAIEFDGLLHAGDRD